MEAKDELFHTLTKANAGGADRRVTTEMDEFLDDDADEVEEEETNREEVEA